MKNIRKKHRLSMQARREIRIFRKELKQARKEQELLNYFKRGYSDLLPVPKQHK